MTRTTRKVVAPPSISFAMNAEDDRDQDPFQVEAEDRAPGRVAFEDHPLAGVEVDAHAGQHMSSPGSRPGHPRSSITSAGDDSPGRAADHRPRPARALRLPPAGGDGGPRRRQHRPRPLRAAAAARRRGRARRGLRAAARAPRRADRGAGGGGDAGAGPARPLGRPRVLLDPLARAAAGAAAGHRDRQRRPHGPLQDRAARRDPARRRGGARAAASGSAPSSAPCWRRCARGRCRPGELATAVGADRQILRRLEQRGLVATRSVALRRAPASPGLGGAAARPELLPEQAARRWRRSSPRSTARPAPRASCSSTASPARARPRSTSPRSRRRWSAARARSSSSPRSASRRRRWPASAPASATASRSSTRPSPPASATTSGAACAAARRASASARAPPSSPPSATSA